MPPVLLGRDIQTSQILTYGMVTGTRATSIAKSLDQQMRPIVATEDDPVYLALFGDTTRSRVPAYATCEVWTEWMSGFADANPKVVAGTIDVTVNATLSGKLDSTVHKIVYLFLNGCCAYSGFSDSVTLTPMAGSTIPASLKNTGLLFLASDPTAGNTFTLERDRVSVTLPLVGGGTEVVWLSLQTGYVVGVGAFLFFDEHGASYSERAMARDNFLSSFVIQPPDDNLWNQGAIVNALEQVRAHGQYTINAMDVNNARGYELDHLAQNWFAIERRSGETDAMLIDRILAATVGYKCIPYAISKSLLTFSPYVIISEGMRGFGAYGRSFYHHLTDVPWSGLAMGTYTEYVALPYYSSIAGGLLHVRIVLQSNAVTTDPTTGAFIYDLIRGILLGGCTFELTLV